MEKQVFNTQIEIEVGFTPKPLGLVFDEYTTNHNIQYELELELKEWGVKSLYLSAPAQVLEFYLDMYKDNENLDEESFSVKFVIDVQNIEIDKSDANFTSSIQPKKMELKLSELSVDTTADIVTVRGVALGTLIF